jgi:hypothetical protein
MNSVSKAVRSLVAVLCLVLLGAVTSAAQTVTTGNLSGVVTDAQGGVLPGAAIVATHTPTGTSYEAVSDSEGRFNILNVRVGPYSVAVTMSGFRKEEAKDITVALGETKMVPFKLAIETVAETVEVVAQSLLIDSSVAGTGDSVSNAVKEALPTINRSITDIARISPLFVAQGSGAGADAAALSVAGNSYRYNSLQIDGAVNNDLFGLAGSAGTPGGAAETQPISLDAIAELQLVIAPYDVRQGGFSGGGINAITKSGTNTMHGTAFFFGRNQDWVGKGVTDTKLSTFKDKQGGGSLGGPIVQKKAFYFGTLEYARKTRPTGFCTTSCGQVFREPALFDRFVADLKSIYGYDPGANPGGEFPKETDSDKYFVRTDFNLGRGHQLTVRNNYIDGFNDISTVSTTAFRTPDAYYRYASKTNSIVGQLNSQFGSAVNEFRMTYTRVRDHRESPIGNPPFPQVTVQLTASTTVVSGTEQFSARNAIDQDIIELNDAFTLLKGRHTFTVGTHNEFLDLKNLFIRDNFGTYYFSSLDTFEAGKAQQFDYSFSATSDPLQRAAFKVRQWGFYAGDTWRAAQRLTVTYGVRLDAPTFPEKPHANPLSVANFGFATDVVPSHVEWSPRVGINYDLSGKGTQQIRGGIGLFTGRPAYVWISNQFGNTGIDFTRIGASRNTANQIPFVTDAFNQPHSVTGAPAGTFTNEIDMIDPDFKYPSIMRGNVGYDHTLPWGLVGTADFLWSKTVNDIKYQNLNFIQASPNAGIGGRPFFTRKVTTLSDAILLENTDQGYSYSLAYEVRRPFKNGLFVQGSYSYGRSRSIMDGTSDQAASNWGFVYVPGNANDAPLARSNYDPGHRVTFTASYEVPVMKSVKPVVSLFYSGLSGRPYTLVFNGDVNGDNRTGNDLVYIPTSSDALTYTGGTYQDFLNWINGDSCLADYVGKIIPRNACRVPWTNTLDGRFAVQLPYKRFKTEVTLDILNMINLFNNKKGLILYASNNNIVQPAPVPSTPTLASNVTGYNITTLVSPTFTRFLRDDLRSRWQMQLGARVRF